jgi:hypothetical protein
MLSRIIVKTAGMGKEGRHKYYPRPSSAGPERCIRQMTYHARNFPEDTEMGDRFVIVLDDSTFHEELTADWIRTTTFQLSSQQMEVEGPEANGEPLKGSIDGVITDLLGIDRLWEHKAINHFTFQKYWGGLWPLDYITQCCIYILGLRKVNPDINQAVLLIKNKNTSQYMDMVIQYDEAEDKAIIIEMEKSSGEIEAMKDEPLAEFPNIVGDAVKKFEVIEHHRLNETLPDRPYEVGTDFPCSYCSWQETCWEGYEEEFDKLLDDIALEQEMEERCRYYLEKDMHLKADDAEVKELKAEILQIMRDLGAKSGRVGPYAVKIMQRKTRGKISEWIRITKPKPKGGNK